MKKTFIIALLLVFAFSSSSFARSNWGVGISNALSSIVALEFGGLSQMTAGTLFYNFNDRNSIEGGIGVLREADKDGDTMDMTAIGIKYLFNIIATKNNNLHIGVQGATGTMRDEDGDSNTYTSINLIFGGETFINDSLSMLLDLTASSSNFESSPSSSDDGQITAINIWPTVSFRLYVP